MIKNFKLVIEYDGTPFYGWQRQPDVITVQEEIEKALGRILNQDIKIYGSGRTDAGVHALAQTACFNADTNIRPRDLKKGLNSLIKHPIVIHECSLAPLDFHARYSVVSKEYHYLILNRPDPCAVGKTYQWHISKPLDIEPMRACCKRITGVHDFKSFENSGSPRSSTVREIFFSEIDARRGSRLVFKIAANGFLKYMVRNLIGTIVLCGEKKISIQEFSQICEARDRTRAGPTAPAHGLFLKQVNYS
jgi:tRNA pseudouridine38-40 synthase